MPIDQLGLTDLPCSLTEPLSVLLYCFLLCYFFYYPRLRLVHLLLQHPLLLTLLDIIDQTNAHFSVVTCPKPYYLKVNID